MGMKRKNYRLNVLDKHTIMHRLAHPVQFMIRMSLLLWRQQNETQISKN